MFPEAWGDIALMVAMLVETFLKEILCKDACLRETIQALLYFDIDYTVVGSQANDVVGFMKSRGRLLNFKCMYSGWSIGVLR
jgi:hypothetical protein